MSIEPYRKGHTITLENGELSKDYTIDNDTGKMIVLQFVGINAFCQDDQQLYFSIHVKKPEGGIFPIAPAGAMPFPDITTPVRMFGSQRIKLYIDPEGEYVLNFERSANNGLARASFALSGRLLPPEL